MRFLLGNDCMVLSHWTNLRLLQLATLSLGILTALARATPAQEPLHRQIDALIAAKAQADSVTLQPRSDDAQFVRRVYLDLVGRIPTATETKQFLDDAAGGDAVAQTAKRSQLIDRLLASSEHPRRMQELFNAMLMERRGEHAEWTKFLRKAFEKNLPWNEIARAIIKPNPDNEELRGAAFFMTSRLVSEGAMAAVDVPSVTRDVGRLFAGVDLQCAQCHDHLTVEDYHQRDFQGLHMAFENVETRGDLGFPAINEKVMAGKKTFLSVFVQEKTETGLVVPGGKEIDIVTFPQGEEFAVPPDPQKRLPGQPKFSPLGELAANLTTAENPLFSKNIANRMWHAMMGRGLVEPLDLHHSKNPPSHPELLELLARDFAAHQFDLRYFLRELALSETYQRTSLLPADGAAPAEKTYAVANERRLSAEQIFLSFVIATGEYDRLVAEADASADKTPAGIVDKHEHLTLLKVQFLKAFANPPAEPEIEFEPSVQSALFLMHDHRVLGLLKPQANIVERLAKLDSPDAIASELCMNILSRPPTAADRVDVAAALPADASQRIAAMEQLVWAMLSSTEFCVNH